MAKYTSDAKLISGAGKAYKDWSNVPGMYKGLEGLSKAGIDLSKEREKERKKEEKRLKEENEIALKREDAFYKVADPISINAGSFMGNTFYNYLSEDLNITKDGLLQAQKNNDRAGITAANTSLNNRKAWVDGIKTYRDEVTSDVIGLNMNAMEIRDGEGNLIGDGGRNLEIVTDFIGENCKITFDKEKGEEVYSGETKSGHKWEMTFDEIKAITILNDRTLAPAFTETREKVIKQTDRPKEGDITTRIKGLVPSEKQSKELLGFMHSPIDGLKNFTDLLKDDKSLRDEVEEAVNFYDGIDGTPKDGIISDDEFEKFKKVIVDPYNDFWKVDGETSMANWAKYAHPIVIEKLSNGLMNDWNTANPEEIEIETDFDAIK